MQKYSNELQNRWNNKATFNRCRNILSLSAAEKRQFIKDANYEIWLRIKHGDNPRLWTDMLKYNYFKNAALSLIREKPFKFKTELIKAIRDC